MNEDRLVLFAHGSRDPVWQETFRKLVRDLGDGFGRNRVSLAFMEYAKPTLEDALTEAAAGGAGRVWLLPLFFSAGGHVSRDLPNRIDHARRGFPDLEVDMLEPVGEHPAFAALVVQIARSVIGGAGSASGSGRPPSTLAPRAEEP